MTPEHRFKSRGRDARAVRRPAGGDRQHPGDRPALRLHGRRRASRSCRPSPTGGDGGRGAARARPREGLEVRLAQALPAIDARRRGKPYRERLEFELGVIVQMGFPGYFLIVADFIKWAKAQRHPGRAGPRLGRRLAGRLGADHHRPRPAALRPAVRALPQPRARLDAGLRHRLLPGPARRGDRLCPASATAATGWRRSSPSARCRRAPRCATSAACCRCRYGQVDRLCKLVPNNPANPVTLQQAIDERAAAAARRGDDDRGRAACSTSR